MCHPCVVEDEFNFTFDLYPVGRWFESPAVPKTKSQNRSGEDDGRLVLSVVLHQLQSQRSSTFLPTRIHHLEVPQPRSRSFKTDLKTFSNYYTGFPVSLGLLHRTTFPSQIKSVVLLEKLALLRRWIKTISRWSRKIQGLLLCRQDSDSDSDLLSLRCTVYVHTCERLKPRSSNTITSAKTWWKYTIKTLKPTMVKNSKTNIKNKVQDAKSCCTERNTAIQQQVPANSFSCIN